MQQHKEFKLSQVLLWAQNERYFDLSQEVGQLKSKSYEWKHNSGSKFYLTVFDDDSCTLEYGDIFDAYDTWQEGLLALEQAVNDGVINPKTTWLPQDIYGISDYLERLSECNSI